MRRDGEKLIREGMERSPATIQVSALLGALLAAAAFSSAEGGRAPAALPSAAPVEEAGWVRPLAGAAREHAAALAVDREGNAYVVGRFRGEADLAPRSGPGRLASAGETDVLVARIDPAGGLVWVRVFGGLGADEGRGVAAVPDGLCLTGFFSGSVDFDPGPGRLELSSAGSADAFIACLDREGGLRWARGFGGRLGDVGSDLASDAAGNLYMTGDFQGSAGFASGAGVSLLQSAGRADAFLVKLDSAGRFLWARRFGGPGEDHGRGLDVDAVGNVALAGSFEETAGFGPEGGNLALASAGRSDGLAIRLDASGRLFWARALGGSGADLAEDVVLSAGGAVYATGRFSGTAEFAPDPGGARLASAGSTDVFAVRIEATGRVGWARQLGGPADDLAAGIAGGADGVWVAGLSLPAPSQGPAPAASFVAGLDAHGMVAASGAMRSSGNLQVLAVASGPVEAPYIAGVFEGAASLETGGRILPLAPGERADAFVARLAPGRVVPRPEGSPTPSPAAAPPRAGSPPSPPRPASRRPSLPW